MEVGPQIGEVTCGGSPDLSCKRDQINVRDCMDRRVTPSKRVTSPTWGTPPSTSSPGRFSRALEMRPGDEVAPPCKQTLTHKIAQKLSRTSKEL